MVHEQKFKDLLSSKCPVYYVLWKNSNGISFIQHQKAARNFLDDLGEPVDAFSEVQVFVSMFGTTHSGKLV